MIFCLKLLSVHFFKLPFTCYCLRHLKLWFWDAQKTWRQMRRSKFIHPLHSFSRDGFHTNRFVTTLGDQGWKQELLGAVTSVVPKARWDNTSGSSVAALFGKNRFEMFFEGWVQRQTINRSCKLALLSCRTSLSRSDLKTASYSCCIYSYVSVLQWNYHKPGTKASCKWKSCANRNNKKRRLAPNKCCSVIAIKVCVFTVTKVSFLQKVGHMHIFTYCEQLPVPTGLCAARWGRVWFLAGLRPCESFRVSTHMCLFRNWKQLLFPGLSWQPAQKAVCFMFINPGRSPALVSVFLICQEHQ